jgi:N utilization substance protein A
MPSPAKRTSTRLPPLDFGRIAAQTAKQVIVQKVREAERDRQYQEFKDRVGEIVNGVVKRVEYGNVIVDLGRGEAIMRRDELIPRESVPQRRPRPRLYLRRAPRTAGPQIFLSRTHPQFMAKLFAQEVPEIYDGIIEIKAVARDPGSRAKIAVISRDSSASTRSAPASACAARACRPSCRNCRARRSTSSPGRRHRDLRRQRAGSRPKSPRWCSTRIPRASRWSCRTTSLSLAIGRRGQNVRLASQLTGWDIDILTEAKRGAPPGRIQDRSEDVHRGAGRGRRHRAPADRRGLHLGRGRGILEGTKRYG